MKKELIICFIVVTIVIVGNVLTQNYTKQSAREMNEQLSDLKSELMKDGKNVDRISEKINQVRKIWDEKQEILAFYIEHNELEKVETQLFLLGGEIEAKVYDDAIPEIEKCIFILEHIEDKTALDIKNIF